MSERERENSSVLFRECDMSHSTSIAHILEATAIALGAGILLSVSNFKKLGNGIFASARETSAIVTCKTNCQFPNDRNKLKSVIDLQSTSYGQTLCKYEGSILRDISTRHASVVDCQIWVVCACLRFDATSQLVL